METAGETPRSRLLSLLRNGSAQPLPDTLPPPFDEEARGKKFGPIDVVLNRTAMGIRMKRFGLGSEASALKREAISLADYLGIDFCELEVIAGLLVEGIDMPQFGLLAFTDLEEVAAA